MSRTEIDGDQIFDGSVQKKDIDTTTSGEALITSLSILNGGFDVQYTGPDMGTGDVTLELLAGNFGTAYYAFQILTESTTTDNGWILKLQDSTPTIDAGKYIVHYRAQLTNTLKKIVGFQVNWRLNGVTGFATIEESFNPPALADTYETRAAFEEITVSQDGIVDLQVLFGQTTAGGTGKIRNVALYLFKVGEL